MVAIEFSLIASLFFSYRSLSTPVPQVCVSISSRPDGLDMSLVTGGGSLANSYHRTQWMYDDGECIAIVAYIGYLLL